MSRCERPDIQRAPTGVIVDLSTTTVASARSMGERLGALGIAFADAPVARTVKRRSAVS